MISLYPYTHWARECICRRQERVLNQTQGTHKRKTERANSFQQALRTCTQYKRTVSELPKWTYLLECAFMIIVGAGLIAFGIWMYNEGAAFTEDAVIPWILMMACGPFLIVVGFYRSVMWTFRKVRSSLSKKKTEKEPELQVPAAES